jgi:accessory gene regulator protein AgrB
MSRFSIVKIAPFSVFPICNKHPIRLNKIKSGIIIIYILRFYIHFLLALYLSLFLRSLILRRSFLPKLSSSSINH